MKLAALIVLFAVSALARDVAMEAYFNPGAATSGIFQYSVDLTNWVTFYTFPYPTNGAWVRATNTTTNVVCYYRAGYIP